MNKKIMALLVFGLLVISLAFAAEGNSDEKGMLDVTLKEDNGNQSLKVNVATQNQGEESKIQQQIQVTNEVSGEQIQAQNKVQSGEITSENGQKMQLQVQSNNAIQLESNGTSAQTSMEMVQEQTQNGTKLQVKLSNGKNAEVKVMPNVASETAIERLQLKVCSSENNCSIELKEVGTGNQTKAAYEVKAQKESKVLGLFKAKMQVQTQIDAETGEVLRTNKPWWAFIAAE